MSANDLEIFEHPKRQRILDILEYIQNTRILIIGDICLDVYWKADMTKSELSRETPHYTLPVIEEKYFPGAGGNVANNIAALKPGKISVVGIVGDDWRGDILLKELKNKNVVTEAVVLSKNRVTEAFCKPMKIGLSDIPYEDPRIDFRNLGPLSNEDEQNLIELLDKYSANADVICVCDQQLNGCITEKIRDKIIQLSRQGVSVIVDSRYRIGLYKDVILKPNEVEGISAVNPEVDPRRVSFEEYINAAKILANMNESKVFMTLGSKGCIYSDGKNTTVIPAFEVNPPIDICGAGDTFLSALACTLACGAKPYEAAYIANIASSITVKKIGMTGTASLEEIMGAYE